jgi:hypothetical protein
MFVKPIFEDLGSLVFASAPYTIPNESLAHIKAVRHCVPKSYIYEEDADPAKWARDAYGKKFKLLTLKLAKKLTGVTVPSLSNQRWMDFLSSTKQERAQQIKLMTIHGVFEHKQKKTGLFGPSKKTICVVSTVQHGEHDTFQTYLWDGHFGSGSGHDPVFVWSSDAP